MADKKMEFRISFRTLLSDVVKALGWPEPLYYQASLSTNSAHVVLVKGCGPNACLFKGEIGRTLSELEEQAAEQAVDFLVQKKQVIIDDVNLNKREVYKACCKFYQRKREAVGSIEQNTSNGRLESRKKMKVVILACVPRTITVDFWDIWLQIVMAYLVTLDEMDFLTEPNGDYVYCFTISWPKYSSKERYFIGDSFNTMDKAKQSLAKKAIAYFQNLYGFSVKDANFNRMMYSKIRCGSQREKFLSAKERHVNLAADLDAIPVFIEDECRTPEGPAYGIRTGLSLPPPPKKPKTVWTETASCSESLGPVNHIGNVESTLFSRVMDNIESGNKT